MAAATVARRDGDVISLGAYGGSLGGLIRAAKFDGGLRLLDVLGAALGVGLAKGARGDARLREAWLVPVPSHPRRRRKRGPDPSARLARAAATSAARLAVPEAGAANAAPRIITVRNRVVPALRRVRHDRPQSTRTPLERETNVRQAFALDPAWRPRLVGRALVLVDDVLTSGATARAAAATLVAVGAEVLLLLVVAGPSG